jgi:CRISPR system Cascade subunit CasA
MISLAGGWQDDKERLQKLVAIGKGAKKILCGKLLLASNGYENKKKKIKLKGLRVAIYDSAEKLFYARTENLIHQTFSSDATFSAWGEARRAYVQKVANHCREIFEELTKPYMSKPDLIPIIAWAERGLNIELKKLKEDNQ